MFLLLSPSSSFSSGAGRRSEGGEGGVAICIPLAPLFQRRKRRGDGASLLVVGEEGGLHKRSQQFKTCQRKAWFVLSLSPAPPLLTPGPKLYLPRKRRERSRCFCCCHRAAAAAVAVRLGLRAPSHAAKSTTVDVVAAVAHVGGSPIGERSKETTQQ